MRRFALVLCLLAAVMTPAGAAGRDDHALVDAVLALEATLAHTPRGRAPLNWASLENHLGLALHALGEREPGIARLLEAVAAFNAALEERRRDRVPLDWAATRSNLGHTLALIGEREDDAARLRDAVATFDAALEEFRPDRAPIGWAKATGGQGIALMVLAAGGGDLALAERALRQLEQAVAMLGKQGRSPLARPYRARLAEARALVARLRPPR